ncbi:MAG: hypothetical protein HYT22_00660 [Candidatus Niyogibacteria bacterium]|nr:hypothetical protein [Candidatus Niyogibacteria bacterium]
MDLQKAQEIVDACVTLPLSELPYTAEEIEAAVRTNATNSITRNTPKKIGVFESMLAHIMPKFPKIFLVCGLLAGFGAFLSPISPLFFLAFALPYVGLMVTVILLGICEEMLRWW